MKKLARDIQKTVMVLIASAEPELRKRWMLGIQNAWAIHEVCDRRDLEQCMIHFRPAVLLLDLNLPHMGEFRRIPAVQRLCPSTRIILFSGSNDDRGAICALKAGARGYCPKEIDTAQLRKAVQVVQKDEVWVGRKVICRLLEELISRTEGRVKDAPPRRKSTSAISPPGSIKSPSWSVPGRATRIYPAASTSPRGPSRLT